MNEGEVNRGNHFYAFGSDHFYTGLQSINGHFLNILIITTRKLNKMKHQMGKGWIIKPMWNQYAKPKDRNMLQIRSIQPRGKSQWVPWASSETVGGSDTFPWASNLRTDRGRGCSAPSKPCRTCWQLQERPRLGLPLQTSVSCSASSVDLSWIFFIY